MLLSRAFLNQEEEKQFFERHTLVLDLTKEFSWKYNMFSTPEQLEKRTGKKGTGRFDYLQQLVTEFENSKSVEAKEQVLANLANFAYDPINYEHLRQLKVLDLFLDHITDENPKFVQFALAGLCNLALDAENKDYILHSGGVGIIASCLSSNNEETVLSAITTLMFLVTPASKPDITSPAIVDCMLQFSKSCNPRLNNLATIFLEDYCTLEQVSAVEKKQSQPTLLSDIPLPPGTSKC